VKNGWSAVGEMGGVGADAPGTANRARTPGCPAAHVLERVQRSETRRCDSPAFHNTPRRAPHGLQRVESTAAGRVIVLLFAIDRALETGQCRDSGPGLDTFTGGPRQTDHGTFARNYKPIGQETRNSERLP
jgi:hypothetical protein